MHIVYPALFYYDSTDAVPYYISFPDFNGAGTQGDSLGDALYMASDYLGMIASDFIEDGENLPPASNINHLSLDTNNPFKDDSDYQLEYDPDKSFISLVSVDVTKYLNANEPVKKTLTIPKWADKLGKEMNINFSETLTDAIANKKLGV